MDVNFTSIMKFMTFLLLPLRSESKKAWSEEAIVGTFYWPAHPQCLRTVMYTVQSNCNALFPVVFLSLIIHFI